MSEIKTEDFIIVKVKFDDNGTDVSQILDKVLTQFIESEVKKLCEHTS